MKNTVHSKELLKIVVLLGLQSHCILPFEWVEPSGKQTSYLFAPGIHNNEKHVAQYTHSHIASTGQRVYTDNEFTVLKHPYTVVNFPETILDEIEEHPVEFKKSLRPDRMVAYLYHKIITWRNDQNDVKERMNFDIPTSSQDVKRPFIKRTAINLGQEGDIEVLNHGYKKHMERFSDTHCVLYGVSRGAATSVNFLATAYQDGDQKIGAAILEAPFDSIETVLENMLESMVPVKWDIMRQLFYRGFRIVYPEYNPSGLRPIDVVHNIPSFLPILLVTSQKDTLVPMQSTKKLYYALKKAGHKHVYLLELQNSSHPRYMMDNDDDKFVYECVVHAFYQRYGLAYNPELAKYGVPVLTCCQP